VVGVDVSAFRGVVVDPGCWPPDFTAGLGRGWVPVAKSEIGTSMYQTRAVRYRGYPGMFEVRAGKGKGKSFTRDVIHCY
jgi:hypothetical protein